MRRALLAVVLLGGCLGDPVAPDFSLSDDLSSSDDLSVGNPDLSGADLASEDSANVDLSMPDLLPAQRACGALAFESGSQTTAWAANTPSDPFDLRGAMAVEAWVFATGTAAEYRAIAQHDVGRTQSWGLWLDDQARPTFCVGSPQVCATAPGALERYVWVHLAGVFDPSNGRILLYVQGTEAAQMATGLTQLASSGAQLVVGGARAGGALFRGIVDEVRVSSSARYTGGFTPSKRLTADASTVALYRFDETAGNLALDVSGNGRHLTLVDGAQFSAWCVPSRCNVAQFSGGAMFTPPAAKHDVGSFTLEAWVHPTSFLGSTNLNIFGRWNQGSSAAYMMYLSTRAPRLAIWCSGTGFNTVPNTAPALPLHAWTHVAVVLNGSTGIVYVNGFSVASMPMACSTPNAPAGVGLSLAYDDPGGGDSFIGYLDDARLSSSARAISFPPPLDLADDAETIALFKLDGTFSDSASTAPTSGGTDGGVSFVPGCI